MSDGAAILLVGLGLGAVVFLTRSSAAAAPAAAAAGAGGLGPVPPGGGGLGVLQQAQLAAPYGQLTSLVGHTAQSAPTWAKIAVPVIGLNSAVQSFIDHPSASLKSAGNAVGSAASNTYHAVGGAISSAGSAIASIF